MIRGSNKKTELVNFCWGLRIQINLLVSRAFPKRKTKQNLNHVSFFISNKQSDTFLVCYLERLRTCHSTF